MASKLNPDTVCAVETKVVCLEPGDPEYIKLEDIARRDHNYKAGPLVQYMIKTLGASDELDMWAKLGLIPRGKYKPFGPADSTALLSNFNIDETLSNWSTNSMEMFKQRFYNIKFQMIDFMQYGTELAKFDIVDAAKSYDSAAVVLNTDKTGGPGRHWFCIFMDLRNLVVEFFNSSGNPPRDEIVDWFIALAKKAANDSNGKTKPKFLRVSPLRLQYSDTECGVWSLMYIRFRLMGKSPSYMYDSSTTDDDITECRKALFVKKH
jgi:hypothetical protein